MLSKEVRFQPMLEVFENEWNSAQWGAGMLKGKLLKGQTVCTTWLDKLDAKVPWWKNARPKAQQSFFKPKWHYVTLYSMGCGMSKTCQDHFQRDSWFVLCSGINPGEIQYKFHILVLLIGYSIFLKLPLPTKQNSAHFPQALEIYLWILWNVIWRPR